MSENEYREFAAVYDEMMGGAPYEAWFAWIREKWRQYGDEPSLVLDLACGTGNMTRLIKEAGLDVIGADISEDMLRAAREKCGDVLFLRQSMSELDLYGTVDAAICCCDSLNYIRDKDELLRVFSLVDNFLNPGGLFVFDINTVHKYADVLGENVFAESLGSSAYIWENSYDAAEGLNTYYVTFFAEDRDGRYSRFDERHVQRAYAVSEISGLLEGAGLALLETADGDSFGAVTENSERVFFIAREQKKEKNKRPAYGD